VSAVHAHQDHATRPGTDGWADEHLVVLTSAVGDLELGEEDRRHLAWLAGWDCETVARTAALLRRDR
jgi:hypothetical protein